MVQRVERRSVDLDQGVDLSHEPEGSEEAKRATHDPEGVRQDPHVPKVEHRAPHVRDLQPREEVEGAVEEEVPAGRRAAQEGATPPPVVQTPSRTSLVLP